MSSSTPFRAVLYITLFVIAIGCFLPWGCWGDIMFICKPGIEIEIRQPNVFYIIERGGIAILLSSTLAVGGCINGKLWRLVRIPPLVFAVVPVLIAARSLIYWLARQAAEKGMSGAAAPSNGIDLVLAGTLVLIGLTLFEYRKG
jgi:hypothetical protein